GSSSCSAIGITAATTRSPGSQAFRWVPSRIGSFGRVRYSRFTWPISSITRSEMAPCSACSECRPLLFRVAEGEADPDEALRVARHLPTCTTCRIVLAREIRLARVLESLDDAIP